MSTGRPIATKCPKCKRGKHGFSQRERGVARLLVPQKHAWRAVRRSRKGVLRTLTCVHCLDCGHVWWTTLERSRT